MFDWIFAFFHLFLLLAVLAYAVYSLLQGNILRFVVVVVLLTGYYFLILHKPVKREIERKRRKHP
ncbi:MAG: hypothetical protein ACLFVG_02155 [Candidatus Aminicenantes bacterium]